MLMDKNENEGIEAPIKEEYFEENGSVLTIKVTTTSNGAPVVIENKLLGQ